jgi:hypothetical protein
MQKNKKINDFLFFVNFLKEKEVNFYLTPSINYEFSINKQPGF